MVPFLRKHENCNDDLFIGSFTKRNLIWDGSQKKGTSPSFTDGSYLYHIAQAIKQEVPHERSDPTRTGGGGIDWIATTDPKHVHAFWKEQLVSLSRLVADAAPAQAAWFDSVPQALHGAHPRFFSVASHQLLHHFGLGGRPWISKFVFGFPTVGFFCQEGVSPLSDKHPAPAPVAKIWRSSVKRFKEMALSSGYRFPKAIWGEAMAQVSPGWPIERIPFYEEGDTPFFCL